MMSAYVVIKVKADQRYLGYHGTLDLQSPSKTFPSDQPFSQDVHWQMTSPPLVNCLLSIAAIEAFQ